MAGRASDVRSQRPSRRPASRRARLQDAARRAHRRRAQHGPRVYGLPGRQRAHRPDAELVDGTRPLRRRDRRGECPDGQHDSRSRCALRRQRRRAHAVRARLLLVPPSRRWATGLTPRQPRERSHGRGTGRGRLSGVRGAAVGAHATAGRAPGGVPVRRRLRGAAGRGLGSALVAGRGLGPRRPNHDQERPAHRPAYDDVPAGWGQLAGAPSAPERLRSDRLRRPGSGRVHLGNPRDRATSPGTGARDRRGASPLPGTPAVRNRRRAQGGSGSPAPARTSRTISR